MDSYENEVTASLIKNYRTTLERIEKFIWPTLFTDVNLYGRLYTSSKRLSDVHHVELPITYSSKKLCDSQRPSFAEAMKLDFNDKANVGQSFGPTWSSHWFKLVILIPEEWIGKEVHLRWNSGCEALIWSSDGKPLQGLSGGSDHRLSADARMHFILSSSVTKLQLETTYYIEMACNTLFGAGEGLIGPPDPNKYFTLQMAEISVFDRQIYEALMDLETLHDMAKEMKDSNRGYQALYTANEIINRLDFSERETLSTARDIAQRFFNQKNGDSQLDIVAVGNCHIDSAWLWPYGETIRKCARSWSSTIRLLERPDLNMVFACSQAQQFYWVKSEYPTLYNEMKSFAKEGKFIPVGGTWVEMDGNIPSGESFIRQFLYGQKFFKEEFNNICQEFWLPDTFGYSAQLPQIIKLCGARYFLSQKLSWSLVNKFPHSTFIWEGIDGSEVIAHFPPANTYTSIVKVENVIKTVSNLSDKGRVSACMLLYGHGDGGGGPDEHMLQRIKRLHNVDGCPKVQVDTPENFFSRMEKSVKNLNRWVGELYLELHNATYTTQALMKLYNRKCEFYLQQLDFLSAIVAVNVGLDGNLKTVKDDIECLWKKVLLNQFHDVLPGSSIGIVHEEAVDIYKDVISQIQILSGQMKEALFGKCEENASMNNVDLVLINSLPWERIESLPRDLLDRTFHSDEDSSQRLYTTVRIPPMGFTSISLKDAKLAYSHHNIWEKLSSGDFKIENSHLKAVVDKFGRVKSLYHLHSSKEAIVEGNYGNEFMIYDDIPLYWDAWDVMDYHLETGKPVLKALSEASISADKEYLSVELEVGQNSHLKMEISLPPHRPYLIVKVTVEWKESHKFLKVQFPVNVHANDATYEIQFGHLERPTHFNTSWDWAKYEVCGHKWMDISEYNWGVAVLNDCKYGHAVHKNIMRLSLLRSPKSPDENADIGLHEFQYAIFPHSGTFQQAGVIKESYIFNSPLITHSRDGDSLAHKQNLAQYSNFNTFFEIDHPEIVIEAVKLATHINSALVIRMYESFGGRRSAVMRSPLPFKSSVLCNGLEDEIEQSVPWTKDGLHLQFRPFEVKSVLLKWQ